MTNLKLKKVSTLLGVSVLALSALTAETTVTGSVYTRPQKSFSSSAVTDSTFLYGDIYLNSSSDNTSLVVESIFKAYDDTTNSDSYTYSYLDQAYVRFDATADEFGNNFALQAGKSYFSMGNGVNWYDAGDVLADEADDWGYETWTAFAEVPVMSSEDSSLVLTPFYKMAYDDSDFDSSYVTNDTEGYGAVVNYSMDSTISSIEGVGYYNDGDFKVAGTITGNAGLDFVVSGNVNVTDTDDFDAYAGIATTVDKTYMSLEALYMNEYYGGNRTLLVTPTADYSLSDTTTISIDNTTTYDLDADSISNWGEIYVTTYLADDFYVRPYVTTSFDDSEIATLKLKVYKSF
ncbi:MAG: hypothetical protein ACRQFF_10635 [Sphaerochaeta sp.]